MMPAAGLMAPVLLPVSQVRVSTLIDRQQLTSVAAPELVPTKTLQEPVTILAPELPPRKVLQDPEVTPDPVPLPKATLAHPALVERAPLPTPIEALPVAKRIASGPIATLLVPVRLESKVRPPNPMLPVPFVLLQREVWPIAMLLLVVVTLLSAQLPIAMLI
jgi:hypothetical protein